MMRSLLQRLKTSRYSLLSAEGYRPTHTGRYLRQKPGQICPSRSQRRSYEKTSFAKMSLLCKRSFYVFIQPSNDSVQSTGVSRQCWEPKPCRLPPVLCTLPFYGCNFIE